MFDPWESLETGSRAEIEEVGHCGVGFEMNRQEIRQDVCLFLIGLKVAQHYLIFFTLKMLTVGLLLSPLGLNYHNF